MKNPLVLVLLFLNALFFHNIASAQLESDVRYTEVIEAQYLCDTQFNGLHPDVPTFYKAFGLNYGAFAIQINPPGQDSVFWHLAYTTSFFGQEVEIRANRIEVGKKPHFYTFRPHHILYESLSFQLVGKVKNSEDVLLQLIMDDDKSVVLTAKCLYTPSYPPKTGSQ